MTASTVTLGSVGACDTVLKECTIVSQSPTGVCALSNRADIQIQLLHTDARWQVSPFLFQEKVISEAISVLHISSRIRITFPSVYEFLLLSHMFSRLRCGSAPWTPTRSMFSPPCPSCREYLSCDYGQKVVSIWEHTKTWHYKTGPSQDGVHHSVLIYENVFPTTLFPIDCSSLAFATSNLPGHQSQ